MKDKLIVNERMKKFNSDVLHWKDYDYEVINDNLIGSLSFPITWKISKKLNLN